MRKGAGGREFDSRGKFVETSKPECLNQIEKLGLI